MVDAVSVVVGAALEELAELAALVLGDWLVDGVMLVLPRTEDVAVVVVEAWVDWLVELATLELADWLVDGVVLELVRDEDAEADVVEELLADGLVEEPAIEEEEVTSAMVSSALEVALERLDEAAKVLEAAELDAKAVVNADEVNEAKAVVPETVVLD